MYLTYNPDLQVTFKTTQYVLEQLPHQQGQVKASSFGGYVDYCKFTDFHFVIDKDTPVHTFRGCSFVNCTFSVEDGVENPKEAFEGCGFHGGDASRIFAISAKD